MQFLFRDNILHCSLQLLGVEPALNLALYRHSCTFLWKLYNALQPILTVGDTHVI